MDVGASGCTDKHCQHTDPLVYLRAQLMFRFLRYASAGLHLALLFHHPDDASSGLDSTAVWTLITGAEVRGILPFGSPHPSSELWVAVVPCYFRWQWDGRSSGESLRSWFDAFGLGWGFGIDRVVTRSLSVGLSFYLYKPWPTQLCTRSRQTECVKMTGVLRDEIGLWWSVGLSATYRLSY